MRIQKSTVVPFACLVLLSVGCEKKKVALAPPPAPVPQVARNVQRDTVTTPPRTTTDRSQTTASTTPKSAYPDAATRARIDQLLAKIEDAYFDYNKASLRPDAMKALQADSTELRDILKDYPTYNLTIEGHCDERGSAEYNMALGDQRAEAAKAYLVQVGIPSGQLAVVSYGKEKPFCSESTEACWQQNRRAGFSLDQ